MVYLHVNMCTFFLQIPVDMICLQYKLGCDRPPSSLHRPYRSTVFRHIAVKDDQFHPELRRWLKIRVFRTSGGCKFAKPELKCLRMESVWKTIPNQAPQSTACYIATLGRHLGKNHPPPPPPNNKKAPFQKRGSISSIRIQQLLCLLEVAAIGCIYYMTRTSQRCSVMPRPRNAVGRPG